MLQANTVRVEDKEEAVYFKLQRSKIKVIIRWQAVANSKLHYNYYQNKKKELMLTSLSHCL